MTQKVFVSTLGCPKNEVDSENIAYSLIKSGYELTDDEGAADIILINTCCFIDDAKEESVSAIFDAVSLKQDNPELKVAVTGCMAQRYAEELEKEIPEIDIIAGVTAQQDLAYLLSKDKASDVRDMNALIPEAGRHYTGGRASAYIKISEGCDKCCTYCIIPKIRGKQRSRRTEDIVKEAEELAASGVKELIVVAQDIGEYGKDIYGARTLPKLLCELEKIGGIRWIRLMYIYPETVSDELIDVIAQSKKILRYLDIPLQHVNDSVLKRMNRRVDSAKIKILLEKLRKRLPGVAVRSTFIVGFPGESEEQFEELCRFIEGAGLLRVGAFAYSREEGTPAALMENQIDEEVKQERLDRLMQLQMSVSEELLKEYVGKTLEVLVEQSYSDGIYIARSALDAPEIDGVVYVKSKETLEIGKMVNVLVEDSDEYDLTGRLLI